MYIWISIILLFFLLFFIPHTFNLKLDYVYNYEKQKVYDSNYVLFKLFTVMPLFKVKFIENIIKKKALSGYSVHTKNKKSNINKYFSRALYNSLYCSKFLLSIGFNLEDYVVNSYINAELNSIICIYINRNQEKFNLNNIYYEVYLSNELVKIFADIEFRFTILGVIVNLIKEKKKNKNKYNENNFVQNNKRKVK